ncbi:MAG TPA: alpha/beta family hydrolase [Paucimonas sp.]|nr:alpha/beta family hydrolase [Paucimonas sp.]
MRAAYKELVGIRAESAQIEGMLELPPDAAGVVLFAHGSGSSRLSPRNNQVAEMLREEQFGTLLVDLLTPAEDRDYETRFDISLLTARLDAALGWLLQQNAARDLPIGLFGASTGAAAALQLAALRADAVAAVVSRGGRPDLAGLRALEKVEAPTLLIVGELDHVVVDLNRSSYMALHCEKRLDIVPGATHLFQEPGALDAVALSAAEWFHRYLSYPAQGMQPPSVGGGAAERRPL